MLQIVIDTSAFIAALLSNRGAAYRLLTLADQGLFELNLAVPLVAEYEAVGQRILDQSTLTPADLDDIVDYLCVVANKRSIFYLWRPYLRDPEDDMILELAVAASCQFIVTFNKRHFAGSEQFGVQIVTPKEFLQRIGKHE
ncbi:MAG: PIN domain-containing protein [Caldilineaceae bacterium]|nr:PIN domain-containing protein [Caldilineaceae bacterium]